MIIAFISSLFIIFIFFFFAARVDDGWRNINDPEADIDSRPEISPQTLALSAPQFTPGADEKERYEHQQEQQQHQKNFENPEAAAMPPLPSPLVRPAVPSSRPSGRTLGGVFEGAHHPLSGGEALVSAEVRQRVFARVGGAFNYTETHELLLETEVRVNFVCYCTQESFLSFFSLFLTGSFCIFSPEVHFTYDSFCILSPRVISTFSQLCLDRFCLFPHIEEFSFLITGFISLFC